MTLFSQSLIKQIDSLCSEIVGTPPVSRWNQRQRLSYLKRKINSLRLSAAQEDIPFLNHLEGLIDSLEPKCATLPVNENQTETYQEAIQRGFNPKDYQFNPIPDGEWIGTLDAKIWGRAKRFTTLKCYFTNNSGNRYVLSAFRARNHTSTRHWYTAQDSSINVKDSSIKIGQTFILVTGINSQSNPLWKSIHPLTPEEKSRFETQSLQINHHDT